MRKKLIALALSVCLIFSTSFAYGHSGRTDSSGGHRDNKNASGLGYYHYHCGGYPAHLHSNGVCPYKAYVAPKPAPVRLSKPVVSAGGYKEYIKISWFKVDNAAKYRVYRATSKDGEYKKIGETTKLYFNDKTAKKDKNYYYKVKAVTGNSNKYKTSYYSSYVKGKINTFSGKITAEWSSANEYGKTVQISRELGLGQTEWVVVKATGSQKDIIVDYPIDYVDINLEDYNDSEFCVEVTVKKVDTEPLCTSLKIYFEGHKSKGLTIPIVINEPQPKITFKNYAEFSDVLEFGSELGISPDFISTASGFRSYMYNFSTVENKYGDDALVYMHLYMLRLKERGYYEIAKYPYSDGFYYLLTNGTRQVSVQNAEQGDIKGIIIGVK